MDQTFKEVPDHYSGTTQWTRTSESCV
jgi:hypothetical protein